MPKAERQDPLATDQFSATVVLLTPIRAAQLLARNTKNRLLKTSVVARLQRDIAAGHWRRGAGVIVLDRDGVLVNGQHTLTAVAQGQVSVWCVMVTGADPEARLVIDSHAPRSRPDALRLAGFEDLITGLHSRNTAAGAWHMAWDSGTSPGKKATHEELVEFATRHAQAGAWVFAKFGPKGFRGVSVTPVIAAFLRAAEHYADASDLAIAIEILMHGHRENLREAEPRDVTILNLRNFLISTSNYTTAGFTRYTTYRKVERCIAAFMKHEVLSRIYDPGFELFPYPEEREEND